MAGNSRPYYWAARKCWYINLRINGKTTKRKLGDTKKAAYDKWKAMLKSNVSSEENPTFVSVGTKWLAHQSQRFERGEVSLQWLDRVNRTVLVFSKLGLRCMDFTPLYCEQWMAGKSANYARTELSVVKQVLKWSADRKLLAANPLAGFQLPSTQSRTRILTIKEHNQLCRAAGRKFKPVLRFAWMVGCRPGELRMLRWEQVDKNFTRAVLTSHKTARKVGKPRVIYFPPRAQTLLREYKAASEERLAKRGIGLDFVFINHRKRAWSSNAVVQRMERLRDDTGLDLVAYNYRHTWITRALLAGVDIATVAELSGHTSVAMISRVYGHLNQHAEHLSNAAAKVS